VPTTRCESFAETDRSAEALYEVTHEISAGQKEALENLKQQADIIQIFVKTYLDLQDGKGTAPAYSQIARADRRDDQAEQAIKAAEKDLLAEGIDKAAILKHRDLIKEWLETVILPTEDAEEGGSVIEAPPVTALMPSTNQGNLTNTTDGMIPEQLL
jgi:hypothetical protein